MTAEMGYEPTTPEEEAREWAKSLGFTEVPAVGAARRCGVEWTPWMGDWFTSWSPRNGNSNAEGAWSHWVRLAQRILNDPLTAIVSPDLYGAVPEPTGDYDDDRKLTDLELRARFAKEAEQCR
jgi:hypothetical protein